MKEQRMLTILEGKIEALREMLKLVDGDNNHVYFHSIETLKRAFHKLEAYEELLKELKS